MKKYLSIIIAAALTLVLGACASPSSTSSSAESVYANVTETASSTSAADSNASESFTAGIIERKKFGSVYMDVSVDEFNAAGFALGDSVDIAFSNGYKLEDVGYFSGYYGRLNQPVLVAYHGDPKPIIAFASGDRLWDVAKCSEGDSVTITLHEKGKYLDVQNAMPLAYSDNRDDYSSDVAFANFREMKGGALVAERFYRGASPINNRHNRASITDGLVANAGVNFLLDLADTEENVAEYRSEDGFNSSYSAGLLDKGNAALLGLNASYIGEDYKQKLVEGLRKLTNAEGPYYIHCTEGKDRTGFVCLLLEGLAGASFDEVRDDYMTTYDNYYQISKESTPDRYRVVEEYMFEDMIITLTGAVAGEDHSNVDLQAGARAYLKEAGMSDSEIDALRAVLVGEGGAS